jgi:uncharacterized protein
VTVRVVLDTNIYIAAIITDGACKRIVKAFVGDDFFEAVVSPQLLTEIDEVLHRKQPHFKFQPSLINPYIASIRTFATVLPDPPNPKNWTQDTKDDYLIELALSSGAKFLVSDDKHLLGSQSTGVVVLGSRDFLGLLRGAGLQWVGAVEIV